MKPISATYLLPLVVVAIVFGLMMCSKDNPTETPPATFASVVASGGVYPTYMEAVDSVVTQGVGDPRPDGTYWDCTLTKYDVTSVPPESQTFDPSTDIIYPGSLLQGKSLENDPPDPIVVKRAGGTVYISIVNGSQNVAVDVDEVRGSKIFQAMNDIIDTNIGVIPANFSYTMQEVSSEQQLALALNVSVQTFGNRVSSSLKFKRDESYYSYVVKLDQMMYVMNYDLPTSYSSVFAPAVTPTDLAKYIGSGNPATYISQVSFGRRFYLLIQSTSLRNEVEASLKATFNYATKVTGSFTGTYMNKLENVQVSAFAQGGDASMALAAVTGGPDELRTFLTEGATIRTGVPMKYKLRNLLDNKELRVKVAGNYDVKNCVIESYTIPDSLKIAWFRADTLVTKDASNVVTNWGNAFGNQNDAVLVRPIGGFDPVLQEENGIKRIHFPIDISYWSDYEWFSHCFVADHYYSRQNLPGWYGTGLEFDGGSLVGSSYSIIAVVQMRYGYFLTGSGTTSLTTGYASPNLWSLSHEPQYVSGHYDLNVSVSNPNNYLQLFTMVYNTRDSSMRIFVNGSQRGETLRGVHPLAAFPDATFGAWCPVSSTENCGSYTYLPGEDVNISEVMILQKALTSDQRRLYEEQIRTKYNLPGYFFME